MRTQGHEIENIQESHQTFLEINVGVFFRAGICKSLAQAPSAIEDFFQPGNQYNLQPWVMSASTHQGEGSFMNSVRVYKQINRKREHKKNKQNTRQYYLTFNHSSFRCCLSTFHGNYGVFPLLIHSLIVVVSQLVLVMMEFFSPC